MNDNKHWQILTLKRERGVSGHSPDTPMFSLDPGAAKEVVTDSPVWRVAWNLTGTVLATSSEDGTLQLWRRDFSGEWVAVQTIPRQFGEEFRSNY